MSDASAPEPPVRAVLTDIEGTTSSIAFVKETLFPYARARIGDFCRVHAQDPEVAAALADAWVDAGLGLEDVIAQLERWIDEDKKEASLKTLQGLIWREGYETGAYQGHVYADAVEGLRRWHAAGLTLAVYSSGSVAAQQLLFGHSVAGDLTPLFSAYFDTRVGPKKESASYARIVSELKLQPASIVFLSDVAAELDAARAVGLRTVHLVRPEDGTVGGSGHREVGSFADLEWLT